MTGRITSMDVAKRAGVSQSAVSRVFSGASASAATAEKVRKAAADLGYQPNPFARAMITGRSGIIGLVVAYMENQFYPAALDLMSRRLQERGYRILIFTVGNDPAEIESVVQDMTAYRVDGIVTASVGMTNDLTQRCADARIPIVMFNRAQDGGGLSSVTSANVDGGRRVAEFLIAAGHTQIAHISGWQGSSTGRDRLRGFLDALDAAEMEPFAVVEGHYDRESASEAARDLMMRENAPDAIFVGNDHMAFAVLDTLREELGLNVPQDVSVIGYDDVPLASWGAYNLTTVRQPLNRMVDATVNTLLAQITDPERPAQRIHIEGPLIVRGTARRPAGWKE